MLSKQRVTGRIPATFPPAEGGLARQGLVLEP